MNTSLIFTPGESDILVRYELPEGTTHRMKFTAIGTGFRRRDDEVVLLGDGEAHELRIDLGFPATEVFLRGSEIQSRRGLLKAAAAAAVVICTPTARAIAAVRDAEYAPSDLGPWSSEPNGDPPVGSAEDADWLESLDERTATSGSGYS